MSSQEYTGYYKKCLDIKDQTDMTKYSIDIVSCDIDEFGHSIVKVNGTKPCSGNTLGDEHVYSQSNAQITISSLFGQSSYYFQSQVNYFYVLC